MIDSQLIEYISPVTVLWANKTKLLKELHASQSIVAMLYPGHLFVMSRVTRMVPSGLH